MAGSFSEGEALRLLGDVLDLDPAEREAWLTAHCGGNAALADRVRTLIAADDPSSLDDLPTHETSTRPPETVGVYRLTELIGSGGMGSVYRAERADGLFAQTVAVKFIRGRRGALDLTPLIDAERRLLARMDHEGVARILDGGATPGGLHYLVMEFVDGKPIDDYCADGALSIEARVRLARQVTAALAHAHQSRIVHCDVKPANILVTETGKAKLIDFGVSRVQEMAQATMDGFTRAYASPERRRGEPARLADDVYALAVTLYELVAGKRPWRDGAEAAESEAPLPLPAQLPGAIRLPAADLDAIFQRALSADAVKRYRSIEEFDDDLGRWLDKRPVKAMPPTAGYVAKRFAGRRPGIVGAMGAAAIGLVGAFSVISALYVQASEARKSADTRFGELRDLAKFMIFDLNSQLEQIPGSTPARHAMAERSQAYLDALAASAGADTGLKTEAAVGLSRLAEVQGVPSRPNLGEGPKAKENLERSEALLKDLIAKSPDDLRLRLDLGRTRYFLAVVYASLDQDAKKEMESARAAEADILAARAGAAQWKATPQDIADMDVLLLGARLTVSDAMQTQDDNAGALKIREAEEKRLHEAPKELRPLMDFDYQAGRTAAFVGDSLYYVDRIPDSLPAYDRSAAAFEAGLKANPTHRKMFEGLLYAHWSRSGVLADLGRPKEALVAARLAEDVGFRLRAWDPTDLSAERLVTMASGQVTLMLRANGNPKEALVRTDAEIAERRARAQAHPGDGDLMRAIAVPMRSRAEIISDIYGIPAQCAAWRDARAEWAAVEAKWGLSEFDRKNDVQKIDAAIKDLRCPAK